MRTPRAFFVLLGLACAIAAARANADSPRFAAPFFSYTSGFDARAVAIADVNGDATPDVLILNAIGLEVRLGTGGGVLGPATTFPAPTGRFIAVGDLNGDGKPDVVSGADSLHVGVMLGNGDGSFQPVVKYSVGKGPMAAVLADLNGDGKLDLVCVAGNASAVSVLLGDGAGGFGVHTDFAVGVFPAAIAAGDLDHDGHIDVVVGSASRVLTRLMGDGAGNLTASGTVSLPGSASNLVLADLDGDGWLDAVVSSYEAAAFFVVPGLAGGGFAAVIPQAVADVNVGLVVTDFDGDGRPDVAVLDYNLNRGEVRRGLGAFAFAGSQPFTTPRNAFGLAAGDLNGGGKQDLVSICGYGSIGVHLGNGDGTFGGVQDVTMGTNPWSVACGDLDGDGHADLVTTNITDQTLSVRFGEGGGAFDAPLTLATGIEPHGVTIADLNGDGHPDLVVAENGAGTQSYSQVAVFLANGSRGFGPRVAYNVGRWCQQVAVGDLNGDGIPDLAVACDDGGPTLTLLTGYPYGQFGGRQDFSLGSNASGVAIGDVTRDGKPDVVLAAYYSNSVHVLPGHGDGTYGSPIALTVPGPGGVAIGDVDGDGVPDVIVSASGGLSVFASIVGGGFAPRVDYAGAAGPITVGDFDGDGRLDVATGNGWPSNAVSVWFGQPGGGLGTATAFGAGDRPAGVASGDVDGDGLIDLVSANLQSSTVSLLINTGGMPWLRWLGVPPPTAPTGFGLRAAPNPAHGPGTIRYSLPRAAHVRLRLLDVAGRRLALLDEGERTAGPVMLRWDARALPAGIAFLELLVGDERAVRRVAILQ